MRKLPYGSLIYGSLPEGCYLCHRGSKMVLFVTGMCPIDCFYCPLSPERKGRDVIYANERRVNNLNEVIEEAELMDAEGTGITGGEPLMVLNRVIKIIRLLKRKMGGSHHIHLYTCGTPFSLATLRELENAGLDEIRFHLVKEEDWNKVRLAVKETNLEVGVEVPVLPDGEDYLIKLVRYLEEVRARFINLNELEFSEGNYLKLLERGYKLSRRYIVAARGSRKVALRVIKRALAENLDLTVHFCSARTKDALQTSLRMYRRAVNVAKPHEVVSDEGLLIKLNLEGGLPEELREVYGVSNEIHIDLLNSIERQNLRLSLVEELPIEPRMVMSKEEL
ncbi:MAG: radical SAM protein [Thermofilum sp. ex4484_15]|nr:MAG: radical SAM protein [Thermofilum sp. ex4484_15]